jgi:hypothetical protein
MNALYVPTKKKQVLLALCKRSFNQFESEHLLSVHCRQTAVSTSQNQHGIEVCRKLEEVPGYMGIKIRVCRYWIAYENVENALKTAKF